MRSLPVPPSAVQRRSPRVALAQHLEVRTKDVSFAASSVVVNAHGALLELAARVLLGTGLTLRNLETGQTALGRVVFARGGARGPFAIGVSFDEPRPGFWGGGYRPAERRRRGASRASAAN